MHEAPVGPEGLSVLIDGAADRDLMQALVSVVVHGSHDGRATAEVEVSGRATTPGHGRVEVGTTTLWVQASSGETLVEGRITEVEVRVPDDRAPSTVLYAEGTAPDGSSSPVVRLSFGAEVRSGSVRRRAGSATARCVAVAPGLRRGSRVDLAAVPDPELDGRYEVVELWHRFDSVRGLWVEFVADMDDTMGA